MKNCIVNLRIDVSKISKDKLFKGKKGLYMEVAVLVSQDENKYDTPCSVWERPSKEERESKAERNYLGNGKVAWIEGEENPEAKPEPTPISDIDNLPF